MLRYIFALGSSPSANANANANAPATQGNASVSPVSSIIVFDARARVPAEEREETNGPLQAWDSHVTQKAIAESMAHARKGETTKALLVLKKVYEAAHSRNDYGTCLRALNCCFSCTFSNESAVLPALRRYAEAQLSLCELMRGSDPVACVLAYTCIASYRLMIAEPPEAVRILRLAEEELKSLKPDTAIYQDLLKRVLQGHVQAHAELCVSVPPGETEESKTLLTDTLKYMIRLEGCDLNDTDQAVTHRIRADVLLRSPSSSASERGRRERARREREAMYRCIKPRAFEPTCPVCLEDMELGAPDTMILGCYHAIHRDCFAKCKGNGKGGMYGNMEAVRCSVCSQNTYWL